MGAIPQAREPAHVGRAMGAQAVPEVSQRAKEQFVDCSRVVIFDDKLQTLYSTYEVPSCTCVDAHSSLFCLLVAWGATPREV